ncbi:hypothetical protein B0H14DRAFT_2575249 [Mycena olivaceomarginata]|nr:hypothetical protein B0H14DRAFT_2575249 [Mycena olivaceomarginata]
MSKHKKQASPNAKPQPTPESKEKKRQQQARYRAKPEVRQKQLALMAERRAAIKARRRQWDPPRKNPPPAAPSPSLLASPSSQSQSPALADADLEPDDHTLTPAEDLALCVLMDMATARNGHARPVPTADTLSDISDGYCKCSLYSRSASPESSVQAVLEHPVVIKPDDVGLYRKEQFPPYASPPTSLQKKTRREIGYFGPITGIQHA